MPDAKGVEKHGESSQIIGGGRRSDAAGGDTVGAYAVMDLLWVGAFGCLIAPQNFKKRKNEES